MVNGSSNDDGGDYPTEQLNTLAVSDLRDSGQPLTCPPHVKLKGKQSKTKHPPQHANVTYVA